MNQDLRKKLRSDYKERFGKAPFNGWSVEQLKEKLGMEVVEESSPPKAAEKPTANLDAVLEKVRMSLKDGDARAAVLSLKGSTLPKEQLIETIVTDPRVRRAGGGEVAKIISALSKL